MIGVSGGIHLPDGGRIRHIGRQIGARGVDRGQHIHRGAVDRAAQLELRGQLDEAERARRGQLGQAGDLAQLLFQRRRNRGCHGLRIGAGQLGADLNGRIVDIGQRRDRHQPVGDKTAQQQAHHQQRCRDRPLDEGRGYVHGIACWTALCISACCAALPCRVLTCVPGCNLYWPSTTTVSLALRPGIDQRLPLADLRDL